jgi:glyceraldehyde 3-phosphate dehydrogenase
MSMIPTSTGAARAVGLVLPHLEGKLDGSAIRVPTPDVSLVDLCVMTRAAATPETVAEAMRAAAAQGPLAGILGVEDAPLVSQDFLHDPRSSIFAPEGTRLTEGGMLRVMSWYDNEWAFSCRMLDTAGAMARL